MPKFVKDGMTHFVGKFGLRPSDIYNEFCTENSAFFNYAHKCLEIPSEPVR